MSDKPVTAALCEYVDTAVEAMIESMHAVLHDYGIGIQLPQVIGSPKLHEARRKLYHILDSIAAPKEPPEPQWTPCSERLPELKQLEGEEMRQTDMVLTYRPKADEDRRIVAMRIIQLADDLPYWHDEDDDYERDMGAVSHWMPLPEPPK